MKDSKALTNINLTTRGYHYPIFKSSCKSVCSFIINHLETFETRTKTYAMKISFLRSEEEPT